ncbi:MAG: ABC transporter permease [Deltaproteobacteria bacterium]|nr:ABC transporter permease [Deltaproteobacteria bacterium]
MTARVAARAIWRNRMRSGLTMLGMIIGVAAVIAMVSVGQGADRFVQEQMESFGTNIVMVIPGAVTSGGARSGSGGASTLTVSDTEAIRRGVSDVVAVTHSRRQISQVIYGNMNWSTVIQGVTPEFELVRNWPVASGSFFTDRQEKTAAKVAVLGQTVVRNLYAPGQDPVDTTIRIKNVPFTVVGVLAAKGQSSWGQDQDDCVMVPFSTAERRVMGAAILGSVEMIFASARTTAAIPAAVEEITSAVRQQHHITHGEEDDFTVRTLEDMAGASAAASKVMGNLLLVIASISLLVGGIGIMNILLVSVTERTREIGLRMAIGAKARHILLQFLSEAAVLSLTGGLIGVALGILVTWLIGRLAEWPTALSPASIAIAFLVSGSVGVFFGFYPARKAAHLDPIEALRWE